MGSSREAKRELHKAGRSARCWLMSTCILFSICGSRSGSSRSVRERPTSSDSLTIFVVSFQYKRDAERFQRQLEARFAKFNLKVAEEKTRLMLFGRFAADRRAEFGQKPETFEFLGFSVLQRHIERRQHGLKRCRTAA